MLLLVGFLCTNSSGVIGLAVALGIVNWLIFFGLLWYVIRGGCPQTWTGLSLEAFSDLWDFLRLLVSCSGMAVGSGCCYYLICIFLGIVFDWTYNYGVEMNSMSP
ncbi:hypothetical protein DCAR_0729287 [Daucus carota subsp. sativus]|uniref:Uncharacterized protein n=1 Tax=Daucus carota subsp. sativus TaxID=79200 RepID=A0A164U3T5_DAUCS|nr:hypothetical protein DCAR_0729287 [Daucus carota subsp. sativus]